MAAGLFLAACPGNTDPYQPLPDTSVPDSRTDGAATVSDGSRADGKQDSARRDSAQTDGLATDSGPPLFNDVDPTHLFYKEIQWAGSKGYVVGCSTSPPLFCPSTGATRAEVAAALVRMKYNNASFTYTSTPHFSDVPSTHWAFKYVQKLYDDGITAGCGTGVFCPDIAATRAQGAVLLATYKYGASFVYSTVPHFSDVPSTHSAFKYVQKLYDANIAQGCGGGKFCPDDSFLRQQLAAFMFRAQTL